MALTQASTYEEIANQNIMADLRNLISNLASNSSNQDSAHNESLAALEINVGLLNQNKADKQSVADSLQAYRGRLPSQNDVADCNTQLLGQLRFNSAKNLVEVCGTDQNWGPVVFDPPGECLFAKNRYNFHLRPPT